MDALVRGVCVQVILDQQEYDGATSNRRNTLFDECLAMGGADVKYKVYSRAWDYHRALQMHCKYMIVDDAAVFTGSFNWSENSELNSFENLIRLDQPEVVKAYVDRFWMKWQYGDPENIDTTKETFSPVSLTGGQIDRLIRDQAKPSQ